MASQLVPVVTSLPNAGLGVLADRYIPFGGLSDGTSTVEAPTQCRIGVAGTISKTTIQVPSYGGTAATIKTRINAVNGNISITPSGTGLATDSSNTDSIAAGDYLNYFYDYSSGSVYNVSAIRSLFQATGSDSCVPCISNSPGGLAISATTRYPGVMGEISGTTAETGGNQREIKASATWGNLAVYISSNLKTTTTTFRTRINSVNGNQSVSFGSGATGWATDTSNTDTLSSGDLLNYSVEVSGTNNITIDTICSCILYTGLDISLWSDTRQNNTRTASATTHYLHLLGGFQTITNTTEANVKMSLGVAGTISNFTFHVGTNSYTGSATARLRINGANGNSVVTISAGTSSTAFEDTTNSDTISATDELNVSITGGTSSTCVLRGISFKFTYPSGASRRIFMIS